MPYRFGKIFVALLLVVGVLAPTAGLGQAAPADAPSDTTASAAPMDPYYFPQTGHYLSGRFRQYWEDRGGLFVFGFPLTTVYDEVSTDGKTYKTQYFERARYEYHPENQQPYDVLLTLVGSEANASRMTIPLE